MTDFWQEVIANAAQIDVLELLGSIFGLLAVWYLIKENILTWPAGIIYIFISFVIFYRTKLYADLALHFVFLVLNIYGWYFWIKGRKEESNLPVTTISFKFLTSITGGCAVGIWIMGTLFERYTDAAVPYWDSATTVLSLAGMWLTARKKIENWYFWIVVDILATGIYIYKEIYFYATLYGIYIVLASIGYFSWKKSMENVAAART
ncbi:MAG: nicotinamide mononucleotide transporter [Bacteroidetes bacterium]|nr:nicotinamide mononucleotide transporter [Bacteroidota bacterium]